LNTYVLWVPLPALVIAKLPPILRDWQTLSTAWVPISMGWLQFGVALLAASLLARLLSLPRSQEGALALTMGLGNTSFVGFPLLLAWLGPQALPIAVLMDQPGSFLVLVTLGVITAKRFAGGSVSLGVSLQAALRFPPLVAFLGAIAFAMTPWNLPASLLVALDAVAASLVPVAVVAIGMQLVIKPEALRRLMVPLAAGLAVKLVLMPALAALLYLKLAGQTGLTVAVTVAEAAMGPMVTAAVLAEECGLDAELASLMAMVGALLSLVTVPLWLYGLGFIQP